MKVRAEGKIVDFAQLEPGSVFIADLHRNQVVRMMKAFVRREDGVRRDDMLVTIGPFTKDDSAAPGIYDPRVLNGRPVLDLSDSCDFLPSLNPTDFLAEPPSYLDQQAHGVVFIAEDEVLLAAQNHRGGARLPTGLLDVSSGEVILQLNHDRFFATRRWQLVARSDKHEVLFDFSR